MPECKKLADNAEEPEQSVGRDFLTEKMGGDAQLQKSAAIFLFCRYQWESKTS